MTCRNVMWIELVLTLSLPVSCLNRSAELRPQQWHAHDATAEPAKATLAFATLPMSFEPNFGQTDKIVRFLSRGIAYRLFLTGEEAVLALNNNAGNSEKPHNRENFRPAIESTLCFCPSSSAQLRR